MLQEPERASEGLGGTYFFKDEAGSKVAIVKPCDEEPLAPNNPKVCFRVNEKVLQVTTLCYDAPPAMFHV